MIDGSSSLRLPVIVIRVTSVCRTIADCRGCSVQSDWFGGRPSGADERCPRFITYFPDAIFSVYRTLPPVFESRVHLKFSFLLDLRQARTSLAIKSACANNMLRASGSVDFAGSEQIVDASKPVVRTRRLQMIPVINSTHPILTISSEQAPCFIHMHFPTGLEYKCLLNQQNLSRNNSELPHQFWC